jgi:hypothetical protein
MKDNRLHIRISNLLKSEIESVVATLEGDMSVSTFVRSAVVKEIKRIKRNNEKRQAKENKVS